jgi:GNAT superfamily N-acetyltransferase
MAQFELRAYNTSYYAQVEEIFWLTSALTPEGAQRESFRKKYLDDYLGHLCFVAIENEKVLGYILCQPDPSQTPKSLEVFKDYIADYPAHLHINTHPQVQGKGVGAALLRKLEEQLQLQGVKGVHLVTHAEARNVMFYKNNTYIPIHETAQKLIMLGKKLRVNNL